jgi:hypothetical protein
MLLPPFGGTVVPTGQQAQPRYDASASDASRTFVVASLADLVAVTIWFMFSLID